MGALRIANLAVAHYRQAFRMARRSAAVFMPPFGAGSTYRIKRQENRGLLVAHDP
jgi:hypothetical protein